MGTRIEQTQGIGSARAYYGRLALTSPIVIGGFQIGRGYGQALATKLGNVSQEFYGLPGIKQISNQITSFKETGLMAKSISRPRGTLGYTLGDRGSILLSDRGFGSFRRDYITSWEQIRGNRPDPFMSYRTNEFWGGYEHSWDFYRSTLKPTALGRVQPTEVFFFDTGKKQMVSLGKYYNLGELPQLETGQLQPEFTRNFAEYRMVFKDSGISPGRTPLRYYHSIKDLGLPDAQLDISSTKTGTYLFKPSSVYKTRVGVGYQEPSSIYPVNIMDTPRYPGGSIAISSRSFMPSGFSLAYGQVSLKLLEFLEEGVSYVHPRWGKTRPDVKQISEIGLKPDIELGTFSISAQELGTETLGQLDMDTYLSHKTQPGFDTSRITRTDIALETTPALTSALALQPVQVTQQQHKQALTPMVALSMPVAPDLNIGLVDIPFLDIAFEGALGIDMPGSQRKKRPRKKKGVFDMFSSPLYKIHPIEINPDVLQVPIAF